MVLSLLAGCSVGSVPLWFLGECGCGACRKIFWGPDKCGHRGFQVKCVSGY